MARFFGKTFLICAFLMTFISAPFVVRANERGPVTNLPLPRFVSMKAKEGNVRRGPGLTHRIDWVFNHPHIPLLITAEYGHWRRVQDNEGQGGWMHYALLSGVRTVIISTPKLELRIKPNAQSAISAYAEQSAIAYLDECLEIWCYVSSDGNGGWAPKNDLWGVFPHEVFE